MLGVYIGLLVYFGMYFERLRKITRRSAAQQRCGLGAIQDDCRSGQTIMSAAESCPSKHSRSAPTSPTSPSSAYSVISGRMWVGITRSTSYFGRYQIKIGNNMAMMTRNHNLGIIVFGLPIFLSSKVTIHDSRV